jgi:uncharacterized protein (TIGR02001 family)
MPTMKQILHAIPFAFAALAATAQANPTDLGAGLSLSGNMTVASDYRKRGYTHTDNRPAAQVQLDLTHTSGLYVGNFNSNVADTIYAGGNLAMAVYGGWKGSLGDGVNIDVGAISTVYPHSMPRYGTSYTTNDLYVGLSYKNYALKYSYTPTNFNGVPDSKGTWYLESSANFDLGQGWGLVGHVGYQKLKGWIDRDGNSPTRYADYKVGVTKDYKGWTLGLAAIGTSRPNGFATIDGHNAGRLGVVAAVSRSF